MQEKYGAPERKNHAPAAAPNPESPIPQAPDRNARQPGEASAPSGYIGKRKHMYTAEMATVSIMTGKPTFRYSMKVMG